MRNRFRRLLSVALALTLFSWTACSSRPDRAQAATETVHDVVVLSAERTSAPDFLEAVGTVRAQQTTQLASQVLGNVVAIHVHEGDVVRRGQVLAVIDDAQPRASLDRAQAAVLAAEKDAIAAASEARLAEATLHRYEALSKEQVISAQEFDVVKARSESAEARRELARAGQQQARAAEAQARSQLDYTRIRAPFDGLISEKHADVGLLAAPGTPLLTVEDTRRFRLDANVDETEIQRVRVGQSVPVVLESLSDQQLAGHVVQIVPAGDPASRSFIVKVELAPQPGLRSGLFGRALFARGERETMLVPQTAILERGQLRGVYVIAADGRASLRYVTVGRAMGDRLEVLSGLEPRESVVADPGGRELSGKLVGARR